MSKASPVWRNHIPLEWRRCSIVSATDLLEPVIPSEHRCWWYACRWCSELMSRTIVIASLLSASYPGQWSGWDDWSVSPWQHTAAGQYFGLPTKRPGSGKLASVPLPGECGALQYFKDPFFKKADRSVLLRRVKYIVIFTLVTQACRPSSPYVTFRLVASLAFAEGLGKCYSKASLNGTVTHWGQHLNLSI